VIFNFPVQGPGGARPLNGPGQNHQPRLVLQAADAASAKPAREGDRVDLSEVAGVLSKLTGAPPERLAKVLSIKREIDRGTYVTDEKLKESLTRMIDSVSDRNTKKT
jgi:hypothetical protein